MTTYISNPRSLKKSARTAFAIGFLTVFAGCGSATRTATPQTPDQTATTARTTATSTFDSVGPTTTQAPATTAIPATTPDTAATSTSTVTRSTVAPTIEPPVAEPTTTVETIPDHSGSDPVVAIDGNGDAVLIGPDGAAAVFYDGTDPDDYGPHEGPCVLVDGVGVTSDLTTSIIATLCQPSPGSLVATNSADPANPQVGLGRAPVISPDQKQLAAITDNRIVVSWIDLSSPLQSGELEFLQSMADIEWTDDTHVVALVVGHTFAFLNRYLVTDEGLVQTESGGGPLMYALAGVSDGVLYALTGGNVVVAFAADTLVPLPEHDITLNGRPTSASIHDGELRWVDEERHLHIGDRIVAGEYIAVA